MFSTAPPPTRSNSARMPGHVVDHPRPGLHVGVHLAGDDPRHVERGRAQVERAAAHRRGVQQLGDHLGQRARGPAAEAVGPEHAVDALVGAEHGPAATPPARVRGRPGTPGRRGSPPRRRPTRRPWWARCPAARRPPTRSTTPDRRARPLCRRSGRPPALRGRAARRVDQAAVLGVESHVGRALGQEPLQHLFGGFVDGEGHVATGRVGVLLVRPRGVRAQRGQHLLAQGQRQVADQLQQRGSAALGRLLGALAQRHRDRAPLAVAQHLELDLVAGRRRPIRSARSPVRVSRRPSTEMTTSPSEGTPAGPGSRSCPCRCPGRRRRPGCRSGRPPPAHPA